ncbi:MAG: PEP-CTERM sorting domain-containing protein [Methylococcales bacterium]|nr:PEP-CTERM sorting domain-containing protein [Methylococcales bacterium]
MIITDMGLGNFSFQYNYDKILWETGSASGGGPGGLGGTSAAAGWTNGIGNFYQLAGSLVNGGLLDPNQATGLINNDLNSSTLGQYIFNVSNGVVVNNVPEPESIALLMLGLMGFAALRRKENKV